MNQYKNIHSNYDTLRCTLFIYFSTQKLYLMIIYNHILFISVTFWSVKYKWEGFLTIYCIILCLSYTYIDTSLMGLLGRLWAGPLVGLKIKPQPIAQPYWAQAAQMPVYRSNGPGRVCHLMRPNQQYSSKITWIPNGIDQSAMIKVHLDIIADIKNVKFWQLKLDCENNAENFLCIE